MPIPSKGEQAEAGYSELVFGRNSETGWGIGKHCGRKKNGVEDFSYTLTGDCWH